MNLGQIKQYTGHTGLSIIEAMKAINQNTQGILYITDEEGRLIGSVTDGDIRRWIIKKGDLKSDLEPVMNRSVRYMTDVNGENYLQFLDDNHINSVPIVDDDLRIIDILFRHETGKQSLPENDKLCMTPVIIMAGGKGSRLRPYTNILPKPLIPIGDIPILERILDRFRDSGAQNFYVVVNYRRELIKAYFSETDLKNNMHYVDEDTPLGTAGGIRLISERFTDSVIITNCDIIIVADYADIVRHHKEMNNDLTIVSALKNMEIPYGVIHSDEAGLISSMEEKPKLSYLINTGMYVINPDCLELIPEGRVYHMTDLADDMIKSNKRVGIYPISEESFFDMGEFEELKKMEDWINGNYKQ